MCGILGSVGEKLTRRRFEQRLRRLSHRGPDFLCVWADAGLQTFFGHTRLSIVDDTARSNQPFVSADGKVIVVFNGEIYNFKALRDDLLDLGIKFQTSGDTEVLLWAYIIWGEEFVARLNGMWAFAILDMRQGSGREKIFLSRDRAGEKPLYYRRSGNSFSFASEAKSLELDEICPEGLDYYLSLGYVPGHLSLYKNINKLPPAHNAVFCFKTRGLRIWRYWALPAQHNPHAFDSEELVNSVESLFLDSVRLRMNADVPVGVLLSGGLDSSLVAAAAAKTKSSAVKAFTISFKGSELDESERAIKVAQHLGLEHELLDLGNPSLALLDSFSWMVDEPIADSSILPSWLVYGMAGKHVKVTLGGDGGDELFGGYSDYLTAIVEQARYGLCPNWMFRAAANVASFLPAGVRGRNKVCSMKNGPLQQMIWGGPYFDSKLRSRLIKGEMSEAIRSIKAAPENSLLSIFESGSSDLDKMTRTHFSSILPDDFLVKVDRASMAQSIEARTPMLDHRLIEFCFGQLPDHLKVSGGVSRRVQRMIASRWLPKDFDLNRKQGFSIPLDKWLRSESEQQLMQRLELLPSFIDRDEVRSLIRGLNRGRANGGRIFSLIMLALSEENRKCLN